MRRRGWSEFGTENRSDCGCVRVERDGRRESGAEGSGERKGGVSRRT